MRKDASVMTFESYLQRIMSLCNYGASAKKPKMTEIVSFPYGHPKLTDIQKEKNKFKEKFKKNIKQLKFDTLKNEAKAVSGCERMRILRSILSQAYITSLILKKKTK